MNSFHGGLNVVAYTASKHGLLGLTRALANEWTGRGIRVNGIAPGWMETELTRALREDGERYDALLARMPSGRWGTPADLAGAVVYLASDASGVRLGRLHRRRRRLPGPLTQRAASSSGDMPSRPSVLTVRTPSRRKSRASTTEAIVITASITGVGTPRRAARSVRKISE